MKSKKVLIVLIVVIVAIILAVGGFVFAYTTTDFLKSDEQLFYKYIGKVVEDLKSFDSQELREYLNRVDKTPYENNGKLSVKVEMPEELELSHLDLVNKLNVSFSGKTDKANKRAEQSIQINYSDDVTLPIEYRQTGDLYGLTSSKILKTYLAVKMDNLEDFSEGLGISGVDPSILDNDRETIRNDLKQILQIVVTRAQSGTFSKADKDSFALTLSKQDIDNIFADLNRIENNSIITEEVKEYLAQAAQNSNITSIKIIVNKTGRVQLVSNEITVDVQINSSNVMLKLSNSNNEGQILITISKQGTGNNITYRIDLGVDASEQSLNIYLESMYSNLVSQNVSENHTLGLSTDVEDKTLSYEYTLNTTKKFANSIDVRAISESNAEILNNMSKERLDAIMQALINRIIEVNREQMTSLGLSENKNPLIDATPFGLIINPLSSTTNNVTSNIEGVQIFNSQFENYQGEQQGGTIRELIQAVIRSNASNDNKISINGRDQEAQLTSFIDQVQPTNSYNIAISKDETTGYINAITITQKQ